MRRILGVAAATAAAPFLSAPFMYLDAWAQAGFPWDLDAKPVITLMLAGIMSFFIIPIPIVTASLMALGLAWLLERAGFRSCLPFMLVGSLTELAAMLPLTMPSTDDFRWINILLGTLRIAAPPGALCGWIYWRIAIRRTPENARAIEAQ